MNTPRVGDTVCLKENLEREGVVTTWDGDKVRIEWDSIHSSWHPGDTVRIKSWARTVPCHNIPESGCPCAHCVKSRAEYKAITGRECPIIGQKEFDEEVDQGVSDFFKSVGLK